jgi:hypothetical protein
MVCEQMHALLGYVIAACQWERLAMRRFKMRAEGL